MRIVWLLVLIGCASEPVHVQAPAASLSHSGCARVDRSFETVILGGRWEGRDVLVLVDTGANSGSISPSLAKQLVAIPGEAARYAGASGEFHDSPIYNVAGLALGDTTLATFRAHEMARMDGDYDLAIGIANLSPFVVDFQLEEEWFCLRDAVPPDIRRERLAPLTMAGRGTGVLSDISLDTTIAGRPVPAMTLDTGAGTSTINEDLLATIPNRRLGSKVRSIDGSGVYKDEYFVEVSELCVLGVCEPRHLLMPGADLSPLLGHRQTGIIGVPFMKRHRIVLDFPGHRIAIDP
jgi:aspartyl protease